MIINGKKVSLVVTSEDPKKAKGLAEEFLDSGYEILSHKPIYGGKKTRYYLHRGVSF